MLHRRNLRSPSPLTVPGIGFPQAILVGPYLPDLATFREPAPTRTADSEHNAARPGAGIAKRASSWRWASFDLFR